MGTSQVVLLTFFYMVVFFVKSVNAGLSSDEVFDFRDVIAENSQYPPVRDMCTRRISRGEIVEIEDVPYQSLIVESDDEGDYWKLVCGGSIVTRQHVISAAHCFQTKNIKINYRVVAGTGNTFMVWNRRSKQDIKLRHKSSEIWREILDCFTHSHYRKTPQHDFAVLKLDIPVNFSSFVKPIPMLKTSYGIELEEGDLCMVSGFGITEKGKIARYLQMVCLPYVSRDRCTKLSGYILEEEQFCAGDWGKATCKGDCGGPIAFRGYLIGIVSYGKDVCGTGPGIFTKISSYTTGDLIPLSVSHCVMLSLNILKVVGLLFPIFIHNFVVTNLLLFNKFCA